jgi:hypothetical protein
MGQQDPDAFVGRSTELAALRAMLEQVRSGRPQTALIEGPAGVGKTALVEQFLRGEEGIRLLRGRGEQWEVLVPYGVVDQLMRAAGVSSARVFSSRLRVLPVEEPISVGSSLLELFEDLEEKNVVVLLVEDIHWSDTDSLRALLFALRRLVSERVLTLLTVREEDQLRVPDGLRRLAAGASGLTLHLPPLTPGEIQALASRLGMPEFSTRIAARLHEHTGGNPLYTRAVLSELPDGWPDALAQLPAPRRRELHGDLARALRGPAAEVARHLRLAGRDAEAPALPDRVVDDALVAAEHAAIDVDDLTWRGGFRAQLLH